jgi:hypothetical protein
VLEPPAREGALAGVSGEAVAASWREWRGSGAWAAAGWVLEPLAGEGALAGVSGEAVAPGRLPAGCWNRRPERVR